MERNLEKEWSDGCVSASFLLLTQAHPWRLWWPQGAEEPSHTRVQAPLIGRQGEGSGREDGDAGRHGMRLGGGKV